MPGTARELMIREFHLGADQRTFCKSWRPSSSSGDVIVFLHGLGEHVGRYESWAQKFVHVGVSFYAFDLPGHGKTKGQRGHTDSFADIYQDIDQILSHAKRENPGARFHIYGHSMGGCLALGYELNRNSEFIKVVATGPAIKPGFEPPAWKVTLGRILESLLPRLALGNELDVQGISKDARVVQAYQSDPLVHDRISTRWFNEWLRAVDAITMGTDRFKKRMLILHGGADRLTSPVASEAFANKVGKTVTFKLCPDAYHELHHEKCQEEVFDLILAFIKSS